jgi:hypothetical protein
MIKRLKERLFKKQGPDSRIQVKRMSPAKRLENYAEAAALAQGGLQDLARDIIRREIYETAKILVVGNEHGFSDALVDYALALAKRLAYGLVALNCMPPGCKNPGGIGSSPHQSRGAFSKKAFAEGVQRFSSRAAQEGIPFRYVVKSGTPQSCIGELEKEVSRLKFVVTETESMHREGADTSIPVFCISK